MGLDGGCVGEFCTTGYNESYAGEPPVYLWLQTPVLDEPSSTKANEDVS